MANKQLERELRLSSNEYFDDLKSGRKPGRPKGAKNIPAIPTIIIKASSGCLTIRPCISSMFLLPILFSTAPTDRNKRDRALP